MDIFPAEKSSPFPTTATSLQDELNGRLNGKIWFVTEQQIYTGEEVKRIRRFLSERRSRLWREFFERRQAAIRLKMTET
jgi:hypothetical protein